MIQCDLNFIEHVHQRVSSNHTVNERSIINYHKDEFRYMKEENLIYYINNAILISETLIAVCFEKKYDEAFSLLIQKYQLSQSQIIY